MTERWLPGEPEHSTSWSSVAKTISLAVLSFVAINAFLVVFLSDRPMSRTSWIVDRKWNLAESHEAVDDLFVGDSSCNQGLQPDVWKQATGHTALNLCTIGDFAAVDDVWLLAAYIEKHGAPRRVVVQHVYDVWPRPMRNTLVSEVPRSWGFWREMKPAVKLEAAAFKDVLLLRYLPVYGRRDSVRTMLTILARKRSIAALDALPFELTAHGFMPWSKAAPRRVARDTAKHLEYVASKKPKLSEDNRHAIAELNVLAQRHDFELHVVVSPLHEGLARDARFERFLSEELQLVEDEAGPRLTVHPERRMYAASEMENSDHLVSSAARDYTRWVATLVEE